MKKKFSTMMLIIFFLAWKNELKANEPVVVNLSSSLTLPNTIVAETGCTVSAFATVEISNPGESSHHAEFTLKVVDGTVPVTFKIIEIKINDQATSSIDQPFNLLPGQTVSAKLQLNFTGNGNFNKAHLITCKIVAKVFNHRATFIDIDHSNDLLAKEVFIGSSNALCYKCIETEIMTEHAFYSFYIPNWSYPRDDCKKILTFLSSPTAELRKPVSRVDYAKVYFEFIPNGVVANTTIKKVLIKNREGQFLTFHDNNPKFMNRIEIDTHHYQDWVIVKGSSTGCPGDKEYKLVQYIDDDKCFELYQLIVNGKYNLVYRSGIGDAKKGERVIIAPQLQIDPQTN